MRSMELFFKFISKGVLYKKEMLYLRYKEIIIYFRDRFLDYRSIIYRRIGYQIITRKVDELFVRLIFVDFCLVEVFELVKNVIKLIGLVVKKKFLFNIDFIIVRDYLLIIILYENGFRFGLLENVMLLCFKQVQYSVISDKYIILVDKYKTIQYYSFVEFIFISRIFGYL